MTDIENLRELLDEKEYPIAADTPIGRYAQELRNAIGPLLDRLEKMEWALADCVSGLVYIRMRYGDLHGVGFDRNGSHSAGHYVCACGWEDKSEQNATKCPACNGNDRNIPCAYPGEHEQQPGCLRNERLARQAAWEKAAPDAGDLVAMLDAASRDDRLADGMLYRKAAATIAALRREVEELKPFKDAIDDQMIVLHLGTADTYPGKQCLDEIINWQVSISLDPQVSSDAAALRDTHLERAEAAERELTACREFPMEYGLSITWRTAEIIYAGYVALFGEAQSLQKIADRGGFGWAEIQNIYKERRGKEAIDAAIKAARKV